MHKTPEQASQFDLIALIDGKPVNNYLILSLNILVYLFSYLEQLETKVANQICYLFVH